MLKIDGSLEYVVKKETKSKTKRVWNEEYENWDYKDVEFQYDKAVWKIKGALPAIMTSRIIPDSWSNETATVEVNDNPANIEHLNWIMMRYRLDIKQPEIWEQKKAALASRVEKRDEIMNLKQITVSPAFKGELFDFQKEGVDFMKKTDGHCLLADEMGLGKTVTTLAFLADAGTAALPALIVAPVVALRNWKKHIIRHVQIKRKGDPLDIIVGEYAEPRIHVIESGKTGSLPPADFYIINYEKLTKRREDLIKAKLKSVVFDEAHYLRHAGTMKFEAAEEVVNCGTVIHRIALSGTPIYNRGVEVYGIIDMIMPGLLGDHEEFKKIWCDYTGRSVLESKREALAELLYQNIMLRRRKVDVLKNLPFKTTKPQEIEVNMTFYESEMKKASSKLQRRLRDSEAITDLRGISQAYAEFAEEERQVAGIAKVPWVCTFVENMLEIGEPVVVFAYHHAVVDLLFERLRQYNPVFITGRQTPKQKWAAEESFQGGSTNLIICSLRSGNVAIDLFRAHVVIHAEFDWSPSVHKQAEDRLHRIGQTKPVFSYYLQGKGTFDKTICGVLVEKKMEIDSVLGDAATEAQAALSKEQIAKEMIESFNARLAEKGKVGVDITMPDMAKIKEEKKQLEKLAKTLARQQLLKGQEARIAVAKDAEEYYDNDEGICPECHGVGCASCDEAKAAEGPEPVIEMKMVDGPEPTIDTYTK